MTGGDPWKVLGISPRATLEEIKQAFRARVRECHPDSPKARSGTRLNFAVLMEAYRTLEQRFMPRVVENSLEPAQAEKSPEETCNGVFLFLEVSAQDAFLGNTIETKVSDIEDFCPACNGLGKVYRSNAPQCSTCKGLGFKEMPWGSGTMRIVCNVCSGSGKSDKRPCALCRGKGRITRQRTVRIRLPRGTRDGTILKLPGQGPWRQEKQQRDTLFVEIKVKLPEGWNITGLNVYSTVEVDIWTALSGGNIEVQTADGPVIHRCLPSSIHEQEIVLEGRGWTDEAGNRGDHIARLSIAMPEGKPPPAAMAAIRMLRLMWPAGNSPLQRALPPGDTGKEKRSWEF